MIIGVPKEVKVMEHRVGLTPQSVSELVSAGHKVLVEHNAGTGIDFTDADYTKVGATIIKNKSAIFSKSEMIVKVKEPSQDECKMLREDQIIFTYLHLAADMTQAELLKDSKCIAIAYETITGSNKHSLPLLAPMSKIAGRMSVQVGARFLEKSEGGRGVLLGGVAGVAPANVVVIGGGVVGSNAICMAVGLEGRVVVLDKSIEVLDSLKAQYGSKLNTLYANQHNVIESIKEADLVIGAVLVAGASAPKIITREMLKLMKKNAVIVDVAIDQGGCLETSKATTFKDPIYFEEDILHYCVANIPGAVPHTSTVALNNSTMPFILDIATNGYKKALKNNKNLLNGLNVCRGKITHREVANSLGMIFHDPISLI